MMGRCWENRAFLACLTRYHSHPCAASCGWPSHTQSMPRRAGRSGIPHGSTSPCVPQSTAATFTSRQSSSMPHDAAVCDSQRGRSIVHYDPHAISLKAPSPSRYSGAVLFGKLREEASQVGELPSPHRDSCKGDARK